MFIILQCARGHWPWHRPMRQLLSLFARLRADAPRAQRTQQPALLSQGQTSQRLAVGVASNDAAVGRWVPRAASAGVRSHDDRCECGPRLACSHKRPRCLGSLLDSVHAAAVADTRRRTRTRTRTHISTRASTRVHVVVVVVVVSLWCACRAVLCLPPCGRAARLRLRSLDACVLRECAVCRRGGCRLVVRASSCS
jgi:hypothetical protein